MHSFRFFLSGKLTLCPWILNDAFAGQSNLGCRSLLFMTLSISCQPLLACKVSFEKSAGSLLGTPLQVTNFFSLSAFESFIFDLWHFNYDVSWSGPLCIHLVWYSLCFLDLMSISFTKLEKFSFIIFSNRFLISCFFSISSNPMI